MLLRDGHHWVRWTLSLQSHRSRLTSSPVPPSDSPAFTRRCIWRLRESQATVVQLSTLGPSTVKHRIPWSRKQRSPDTSSTGVNSAGSAIGAACCAYCADKFSRKVLPSHVVCEESSNSTQAHDPSRCYNSRVGSSYMCRVGRCCNVPRRACHQRFGGEWIMRHTRPAS